MGRGKFKFKGGFLMSITQKNPSDFDYSQLSDAQVQSYKGKADITISNYDNDSAPVVKVGSVFEDNGSLFLVETSDESPTGYSGISNSTTFYLYYDESAGAFIYSTTAPVWSDSKQGWYNSNDRAFFSMYKDSGGTLYQNKLKLIHYSKNQIYGGLQTDNVKLKRKLVSVSSSGTAVSITHGLDYTKIRGVVMSAQVRVESVSYGITAIGATLVNSTTEPVYGIIDYID